MVLLVGIHGVLLCWILATLNISSRHRVLLGQVGRGQYGQRRVTAALWKAASSLHIASNPQSAASTDLHWFYYQPAPGLQGGGLQGGLQTNLSAILIYGTQKG
jgi:hypothetical protein